MEKADMIKIATIVGALIMVGGMFWGIQFTMNNKGNTVNTNQLSSGTSRFNGTIRTYEPFLVVNNEIPDSLLAQLRVDERVRSVTGSAQGYVINVSSRDDVFTLAQSLKAQGIASSTIANIVLPASIEVHQVNGSVEKVSSPGTVRIWTEPFVDIDNDVAVKMVTVSYNGQLVSYSSAVILSEEVSIRGNATIVSLAGRRYSFAIPWENRTSIDAAALAEKYGNDSVRYQRNDVISFSPPLTVSLIPEKKALPYVTFISDTSASVESNFTDRNRTSSDFSGITIGFPDSGLTIITNDSVDLPYPSTVRYSYNVDLPALAGGYSIDGGTFRLDLPGLYSQNESVALVFNGTAVGRKLVSISGIGPG